MHLRHEPIEKDIVCCDTPVIEDVSTLAQLFVGNDTLLTKAYGMKSDKQVASIIFNNIHQQGTIDKLVSDRAQVEIRNKVKDMHRMLFIND